mmetsp:Transcript_12867/g.53928  ORF Transcript_12867/g.53928 Transcript_12867/m.53928 type:complete len:535 (-) Transcript_12867:196-1800(-)
MRRRARRRRRRRRALQPARHRRRRRFDRRGRRHSRARPPGRGGDRPYVGSHQARRDRDRRARPGRDFEDDRLGDGREGRRRRLRRGARRRRRRRRGNNRVADGTHEPSHRRRARLHVHPVRVRSAELHRRHVRVACDDGEPGIDGAAVQVLRRPEKRPGVRVAVLLRHDHHVPEGSARVGDAATDEVGRRGRRRNRRGAPGGGGGAVGSFWGGGRRYRGVHEDVPYGDGEWPRREIEQHASRYDNTQAADTARKKNASADASRAGALASCFDTKSSLRGGEHEGKPDARPEQRHRDGDEQRIYDFRADRSQPHPFRTHAHGRGVVLLGEEFDVQRPFLVVASVGERVPERRRLHARGADFVIVPLKVHPPHLVVLVLPQQQGRTVFAHDRELADAHVTERLREDVSAGHRAEKRLASFEARADVQQLAHSVAVPAAPPLERSRRRRRRVPLGSRAAQVLGGGVRERVGTRSRSRGRRCDRLRRVRLVGAREHAVQRVQAGRTGRRRDAFIRRAEARFRCRGRRGPRARTRPRRR